MTSSTSNLMIEARGVEKWYPNGYHALRGVDLTVHRGEVVVVMGPSGSGKSTFIRTFNALEDFQKGTIRIDGNSLGNDLRQIDAIRREVGMVFQRPNPFPASIYDNIAYGIRIYRSASRSELDGIVESALKGAALWNEVKDLLNKSALGLSGGQQQRLCIARALAVKPKVLLMDEPCSALDPLSTLKVEELIHELKQQYTIVIVTHNMQQASRVSDRTAFFNADETRVGRLVEFDTTQKIFTDAVNQQTRDYVAGRFG